MIFSCGAMLVGALGLLVSPAMAATKPNFVVIMTDDQTSASLRVMPKTLRLLGQTGTTFSNNFATYPLCCPSRATFLTGQYAHNHGVLENQPPQGGYTKLNHNNTLPLWLQEAGYYTVHIGRYLNRYGEDVPPETIPPGWNDWQAVIEREKMYNYRLNDNGTIVTYGSAPADYSTDVQANRAVVSLTEAAERQPFFVHIAPTAPHKDHAINTFPNPKPAPRHLNRFANEPLPMPPSFNEADVSDKPPYVRNLKRFTPEQINTIKNRYRSRLASLLAVDDLVEKVVDKLGQLGILHNTVIIFTSDNGFMHGEHRIAEGKSQPFDESTRVPLIIRGGGFPAGVTVHKLVANIDLAPTIVALAGATAWLATDGRPLLPLPSAGRDLLIERLFYDAVRNDSFLYVEHRTGYRELYDMRKGTPNYDPYQIRSRHADPAYSSIRTDLAGKLNQLRTCLAASCQILASRGGRATLLWLDLGFRRMGGHPAAHIERRYWPPTSNRACVICPSEQTRTASISTSKTFLLSMTAC
jgi:N-acetylglucosamine-6-sulfatase